MRHRSSVFAQNFCYLSKFPGFHLKAMEPTITTQFFHSALPPPHYNMASTKFVMLGKSNVGKSSLVVRLVTGEFRDYLEPTQCDFYSCKRIVNGKDVSFDLWDTAGQERFRTLMPMYTRDATVSLVVFDVGDPMSLQSAFEFLDEFCEKIPIVALVANKVDLIQPPYSEDPIVKEAKKRSVEKNCNFFTVSAKTGEKVSEMFDSLALAAARFVRGEQPGSLPSSYSSYSSASGGPLSPAGGSYSRYDRIELQPNPSPPPTSSYSCCSGGWWGSKDDASSSSPLEDSHK